MAAKHLYQPPLLVLSLGTATTLHLVDDKGNLAGVAIAPGLDLAMQALSRGAANLPPVAFTRPDKIMGTTTIPCIQAGVYWGYVGLLEGLIKRARFEHGNPQLPVVITGGHARILAKEIDMITDMDVNLSLKGLYFIYQQNKHNVT